MKRKIIILIILVLILFCNICIAQNESEEKSKINVISNKQSVKKEEEFEIKIQVNNTLVAACSLEIYFDTSKIEFEKGPSNSNYSNNRIIYVGISENGKNVQNLEIGEFTFKALEDGIANIIVAGEFYNEEGENVEIDNGNIQMQINTINNIDTISNSSSADNTNLSILRLNYEGISPSFEKSINEYYFIADNQIDNIQITAIPENKNATVSINGNNNLKQGKNIITITVVSADKTKKNTYTIYVTKTKNVQTANANLENLAVRQAVALNPQFDANITKYNVEIENQIETIDILAIPQSQRAVVEVIGNGQMKVGDNNIQINVLAEDRITTKKYEIIVHRRNEQEQIEYEQETNIQVEKVSTIIEEQKQLQGNNQSNVQENEQSEGVVIWIIAIVLISACIFIGYFWVKETRKTRKQ